MKAHDPQILVIFGASGDLAYRKLIPSIYDLFRQELLPDCFAVLGVSRTEYSDEEFREKMMQGIREFAQKDADESDMQAFSKLLYYQAIDTKSEADYGKLRERLSALDEACQTAGNYIYYLSTPPSLYEIIPQHLAAHGLNTENGGWKRLIIEKPFGYDLETARALNATLLKFFGEDQLYRIDHYLGKETVQNLLVTRFSNGIFEPLWNRNYIHHVEITAAESIGVGSRGGYYDGSGAMRDMVQNHLMQLVAMVAMEPPTVIEAGAIRNEVLKVFQSLRPIRREEVSQYVVRGQYTDSESEKGPMKAYRQEEGVPEDSMTETYVAMKFFIDNWRWGGVPFYIRTGKRLPTRLTEIVVHFKETPHRLFADVCGNPQPNNLMIIRLQPNEGIHLTFGLKVPGAGFNVENVDMDFLYSEMSDVYLPSAYERLLLDAMRGDATLYARGDAVETAWEFVNPILEAWENDPSNPLEGYPAGSWGPQATEKLMAGSHLDWREPVPPLVKAKEHQPL